MSTESRSKRKQKSLEEVFKAINKEHVQIKRKARKCNNKILYSVLEELLQIMQKQNKLFCSMKPKLEYLGSYYDGLRVGEPTEYDINVVLKLPVNYEKIRLQANNTYYDCTNIRMPSEFRRLSIIPATIDEGFKETAMWCDPHSYCLSVKMFRSWMQKVVDTALNDLPLVNNRRAICVNKKYYQIATKTSGPANTITIVTGNRDNSVIDVDLVPTFSFVLPKKPIGSKILFDKVESSKPLRKEYFVVPKPSDDDFSWRLAFPFQERNFLKNRYNLKSCAKLLKLLRDTQDFKQLASYYIKTLFLWEIDRKNKEIFWKRNSLSYLVVHMLKKLRDCLAKGEIKNFWCPDSNLIKDKIKSETCINWSNRLSVIIRNIEQKGTGNPQIVKEYFSKKPLV